MRMTSVHLSLVGILILSLFACSPAIEFNQQGPTTSAKDFSMINGDWQGSLTYSDYSSGKRVVISAKATVSSMPDEQVNYTVSYPNEPWEDNDFVMKITEQGRVLDGHVVTQRHANEDGTLIIETIHKGQDDNRSADIRQTYGLGPTRFYIAKDIKFESSDEFLFRNVYEFTRSED